VLLLAAFTPSAIRLYVIGSQTFGQAVTSNVAMTAVGLATVLSAEVGQVVFSLALATLGTSRVSRRLLYASMAITTILSLMGNIQISLPGHMNSPFAWLDHCPAYPGAFNGLRIEGAGIEPLSEDANVRFRLR
jgi:hypothetical protein